MRIKNFRGQCVAINVKTYEEALKVIELMTQNGYIWNGQLKLAWNQNKNKLCFNLYHKEIMFCYKNYYVTGGYKIIEFKDIFEKSKKSNRKAW